MPSLNSFQPKTKQKQKHYFSQKYVIFSYLKMLIFLPKIHMKCHTKAIFIENVLFLHQKI